MYLGQLDLIPILLWIRKEKKNSRKAEPCIIYLIIACDFSLNPKITSWVYSENNQPVQTTQRDNDNQARNVKPDRPSKKE